MYIIFLCAVNLFESTSESLLSFVVNIARLGENFRDEKYLGCGDNCFTFCPGKLIDLRKMVFTLREGTKICLLFVYRKFVNELMKLLGIC